ncbi:hypothetical protein INT44_005674 [Umbelopsis vinacea]|uniref:Thioredoxin domain-containing protein n=1 Tax=Umbelopsis vinacea TaxID=44442 RepID=A0A8H7UKZ2_9FUNG|nr:hypothetical protein INT44_005674 [Umbelopsis vinacea]
MLIKILVGTFLFALQQQNVAADTSSVYIPNSEGKVVTLGSANFTQQVEDSPDRAWFIKFYAPWCTHCKTLAPVWVDLAKTLKGKANIAEVDCTVDEPLCRSYGVSGFPTLKYVAKDTSVEYRGTRDHDSLLAFVDKASKSPVTHVSDSELAAKLDSDEVSLVYLYDGKADHIDTIESVGQAFINDLATYATSDPEALTRFGLQKENLPKAVLWKGDKAMVYPGSDFTNIPETRDALRNWVNDRKYPLFFELGPGNSNDVLRGNKLVVLAFFMPSRELDEQKAFLKNIAESYAKNVGDEGKVLFVWMDGIKHARYVYNVYGFNGNALPAVVISDPKNAQFFAKSADGEALDLVQTEDIVKAIDDAQSGLLKAKSTVPSGQNVAKYIEKAMVFAGKYWFITIPAIIVSSALLIIPLIKSTQTSDKSTDPKSQ